MRPKNECLANAILFPPKFRANGAVYAGCFFLGVFMPAAAGNLGDVFLGFGLFFSTCFQRIWSLFLSHVQYAAKPAASRELR